MFMHTNKQTDFLSISALSLNCNTVKQISPQCPGSPKRGSAPRQTKPASLDRDATPGDVSLPVQLSACCNIACICIIFELVCHRKSHSGHRRDQRFIFVDSCVRTFFLFTSHLSLPKQPILFPVLHSLSTPLLFFHFRDFQVNKMSLQLPFLICLHCEMLIANVYFSTRFTSLFFRNASNRTIKVSAGLG